MQIEIYYSNCFINETSEISKIKEEDVYDIEVLVPVLDPSTTTTVKKMYENGWKLSNAIKTAQSAQMKDFNFLLIFEK